MKATTMKTRCETNISRFKPQTRFAARPLRTRQLGGIQRARFHQLQERLLRERQAQIAALDVHSHLLTAAHEAAALAWVTPFPLLVFPVLFHEKAEAALVRAERQQDVRERSKGIM